MVFRSQSETILIWPIIGLAIFITVFTLKVIAVMRSNDEDTKRRSELPLMKD
jgi:hypothetical protein